MIADAAAEVAYAAGHAAGRDVEETPAVVWGLADSLREWLTPPVVRVVLIRDDEGRHGGEGVLGVDGRVLLDLASLVAAVEDTT